VIEVNGLSKRYGSRLAVDDLTFTVRPGVVTGFLGPNGAGKSTTMRLILGLDRPSAGTATVNGRPYAGHPAPLRAVGALLEARAVHSGRSGYHHLLALAQTTGIPRARVDEVIDLVGLSGVARKRVGGFSLGMGQRLGIAAALLGDPRTVILDEPVNGLDPEGIRWIRTLLADLAADGRTVFLSSHLLNELSLVAGHLIVIAGGRLVADTGTEAFIAGATRSTVRVRATDPAGVAAVLAGPGVTVTRGADGALEVTGLDTDAIGLAAMAAGIAVLELTAQRGSLEEAFMDITRDAVEFRAGTATVAGAR
jgi:ABC-2 type transport system ATP-binding protein